MANGHGIIEEVQNIFAEGSIPQNVSNRLIMAAIVSEHKAGLSRDEIRQKEHCDAVERIKKLEESERKMILYTTVIATVITGLGSLIKIWLAG